MVSFLRDLDRAVIEQARSEISACGFCLLGDALTAEGHDALEQESLLQFGSCCFSQSRSGTAYEAYLADLGPLAASYLRSAEASALLGSIFSGRHGLVAEKSCFTYYFAEGYLAPHLDSIPGPGAVSMLTYLLVEADERVGGPALDIFGSGVEPGPRRRRIRTTAASIVLGHGARVWHGRAPLSANEKVVMINGSYSAAS